MRKNKKSEPNVNSDNDIEKNLIDIELQDKKVAKSSNEIQCKR